MLLIIAKVVIIERFAYCFTLHYTVVLFHWLFSSLLEPNQYKIRLSGGAGKEFVVTSSFGIWYFSDFGNNIRPKTKDLFHYKGPGPPLHLCQNMMYTVAGTTKSTIFCP